MKQILFLLAVLLTAVGIVACTVLSPVATSIPTSNASPASFSASSPIDPCSLLAPADVEKALGEPVVLNPMREMVSNGSLCSYFIGARSLVITSRQFDGAGIQAAKQELNARYQAGQAITGIGDIAFFSFQERTPNSNSRAGTIALMKGNVSLEIALTDAGLSETRASDALKFLAQRAVTRLP